MGTRNYAILGVGIVLGSIGTYFFTKKAIINQCYADLSRETLAARNFYRESYEKKLQEALDILPEPEVEEDLTFTPEEVRQVEEVMPEPVKRAMVNYSGMANPSIDLRPSPILPDRKAEKEVETTMPEIKATVVPIEEEVPPRPKAQIPSNPPHIISEDEYVNSGFDFHQFPVTYYAADDALVTATDKIITPEDRLEGLGEEILDQIKNGVIGPDDRLYVRSPEIKTEFEIGYSEDSFANIAKYAT